MGGREGWNHPRWKGKVGKENFFPTRGNWKAFRKLFISGAFTIYSIRNAFRNENPKLSSQGKLLIVYFAEVAAQFRTSPQEISPLWVMLFAGAGENPHSFRIFNFKWDFVNFFFGFPGWRRDGGGHRMGGGVIKKCFVRWKKENAAGGGNPSIPHYCRQLGWKAPKSCLGVWKFWKFRENNVSLCYWRMSEPSLFERGGRQLSFGFDWNRFAGTDFTLRCHASNQECSPTPFPPPPPRWWPFMINLSVTAFPRGKSHLRWRYISPVRPSRPTLPGPGGRHPLFMAVPELRQRLSRRVPACPSNARNFTTDRTLRLVNAGPLSLSARRPNRFISKWKIEAS